MHQRSFSKTKKKKIILLFFIALFFINESCKQVPYQKDKNLSLFIQKKKASNYPKDWKLIWEEDFNEINDQYWSKLDIYKTERLNKGFDSVSIYRENWKKHVDSWASYMSSTNPETITIKDGFLYLKALKNPDTTGWDNRPYHTGGLWSEHKLAFQYGRLEIRAKLEGAHGAWPALWLIPEFSIYPDQNNGEMDIIERLNFDPFVYQTIHSPWNLQLKQEEPQRFVKSDFNQDDFNLYWVEWGKDFIRYGVNETTNLNYKKIEGGGTYQWPFDQPFFLILSQQLEGWPGKVTNPEELPIDMVLDYIKLYQ